MNSDKFNEYYEQALEIADMTNLDRESQQHIINIIMTMVATGVQDYQKNIGFRVTLDEYMENLINR